MALTRTIFGEAVLNLPRIFQYVSDNPDCKSVRLTIQRASGGQPIAIFENEPEIGTDDTFRFEVNNVLSSLYKTDFPEIKTFGDAVNNTKASIDVVVIFAIELDEDGNSLGGALVFTDTIFKPVNFFRGQLQSTFNPDNTGSISRRFLTNSPNLRPIKRGDFFWIFGGISSYDGSGNTLQEWVIQTIDEEGDVITTSTIDYENEYYNPLDLPYGNTGIPVQMPTDNNVKGINVFVRDKASPFTQRSQFKRWNAYEGCNDIKLWFLNQYNVPELVYMKGNVQRQILNSPSRYEQFESVNADFNQGGIKPFANKFRYEFSLNTGRVKPVEIEYLAEILYSQRIAIEYDGRLFEVVLQDTDLRDFDAKDSVDNITFNFIENRENRFL